MITTIHISEQDKKRWRVCRTYRMKNMIFTDQKHDSIIFDSVLLSNSIRFVAVRPSSLEWVLCSHVFIANEYGGLGYRGAIWKSLETSRSSVSRMAL